MQRSKSVLLSAFILLFAGACGQKGPLFLPDDQNQPSQADTVLSDEQKDQKKDGEEEKAKNEKNP